MSFEQEPTVRQENKAAPAKIKPGKNLPHPAGGWLYRLGEFVTGPIGRWVTLLTWLVSISLLVLLPPSLEVLYDNKIGADIGQVGSGRAAELLQQKFPQSTGLPAIIVFNNPSGLNDTDFARVKRLSDWLTSPQKPARVESVFSIDTVPQSRSELVSANKTTLQTVVSLVTSDDDSELAKTVDAIRNYAEPLKGKGLSINVTGPAGVAADTITIFKSADLPLLLTTVSLVVVLLLIVYRSPLLALMPLAVVFVALEGVNGLLALAAQAKLFPVTQQSGSILSVLLFGVGVDYTIFLVSRYREELQRESDSLYALRLAYARIAEAILSSAGTVIVALLTLLLATLGLYRSLGPSLAVGVAVMLLVGLTLIPAMLAILGRAAFWPLVPKLAPEEFTRNNRPVKRSLWQGLAQRVARRPVAAIWISTLLLLVMGLGNLGVIDVFNFLSGFRQATDSASGYKLLSANFGPGALATTDVVMVLPAGINAFDRLGVIESVSRAVAGVNEVAGVKGPTRPDGQPGDGTALGEKFKALPGPLKEALRQGQSTGPGGGVGAGSNVDPAIIGAYLQSLHYISTDASVVRVNVTLKSDPYGKAALDAIEPINRAASQALTSGGINGEVVIGGVTSQNADIREVNNRDKLIVIPVVVTLTTLILFILLRSLVAPLYLIGAVLLNFFATMGAASFLFVILQGDEGRAYSLPLYAFIFLVSLGTDYTIFLMTRIREEVQENDLEVGTINALSNTGGVITSAGLILAGTFLALAILPLRELYQLGVVVALGVILDTFVVRGIVVPASVVLCKNLNWWPFGLTGRGKKTQPVSLPSLVEQNSEESPIEIEKVS